MSVAEWQTNFLVVLAVAAVELLILGSALVRVLRGTGRDLGPLMGRLAEDVRQRARLGESPDWLACRDAIDRLFHPLEERLRNDAAAALAAGLGGTIVAVMLHLWQLGGVSLGDSPSALLGLGVALAGSLCGVVVHLLIVLLVLPWAERRAVRKGDEVLGLLRQVADEHPPVQAAGESVRSELHQLGQVLTHELTQAFSSSLAELPEVVRELRGHLERVASAVEQQAGTATTTMEGLRKSAAVVAEGGRLLEPAVKGLTDTAATLADLPGRLQSMLREHADQWSSIARTERDEARQRLVDLLQIAEERHRRVGQQIDEIEEALAGLPSRLAEALSSSLRAATPQLTGSYAQVLVEAIAGLLRQLDVRLERGVEQIEKRDRILQESTAEWVRQLFLEIHGSVESRLNEPITVAARQLDSVASRMEEVVAGLREADGEWRQSHERALGDWRQAGEILSRVVDGMSASEEHLQNVVETLGRSAAHIELVAQVHAGFADALTAALREVTREHLDELRPIYGRVVEVVAELESARDRLEGALDRQGVLVTRLVRQVLAQRGLSLPQEAS